MTTVAEKTASALSLPLAGPPAVELPAVLAPPCWRSVGQQQLAQGSAAAADGGAAGAVAGSASSATALHGPRGIGGTRSIAAASLQLVASVATLPPAHRVAAGGLFALGSTVTSAGAPPAAASVGCAGSSSSAQVLASGVAAAGDKDKGADKDKDTSADASSNVWSTAAAVPAAGGAPRVAPRHLLPRLLAHAEGRLHLLGGTARHCPTPQRRKHMPCACTRNTLWCRRKRMLLQAAGLALPMPMLLRMRYRMLAVVRVAQLLQARRGGTAAPSSSTAAGAASAAAPAHVPPEPTVAEVALAELLRVEEEARAAADAKAAPRAAARAAKAAEAAAAAASATHVSPRLHWCWHGCCVRCGHQEPWCWLTGAGAATGTQSTALVTTRDEMV